MGGRSCLVTFMGKYFFWLAFATVALWATPALAGMPAALPSDVALVFRLNDEPYQRFQAISFFLLGIAVSAWALRGLWNFLARDFVRLPRLSYLKALVVVILWGLLFVIVLTMISGARELMTPGAWKKTGVTYTLDNAPSPERSP